MEYIVPLLLDQNRQPVGLFSVKTTEGDLVIIFASQAKWERFAGAASPVVRSSGQFLGSTQLSGASIEAIADQLAEIDPALDGNATFIPDTAPIVNDVVSFFEQQA